MERFFHWLACTRFGAEFLRRTIRFGMGLFGGAALGLLLGLVARPLLGLQLARQRAGFLSVQASQQLDWLKEFEATRTPSGSNWLLRGTQVHAADSSPELVALAPLSPTLDHHELLRIGRYYRALGEGYSAVGNVSATWKAHLLSVKAFLFALQGGVCPEESAEVLYLIEQGLSVLKKLSPDPQRSLLLKSESFRALSLELYGESIWLAGAQTRGSYP